MISPVGEIKRVMITCIGDVLISGVCVVLERFVNLAVISQVIVLMCYIHVCVYIKLACVYVCVRVCVCVYVCVCVLL